MLPFAAVTENIFAAQENALLGIVAIRSDRIGGLQEIVYFRNEMMHQL